LDEVATIALVVHGVGDHALTNLIGEAQKGFLAAAGPTAECTIYRLDEFPQLVGPARDQDCLRLQFSNRDHLVIPLLWSHVHSRTVAEPEKKLTVDLTKLISPFAWWLVAYAFRCVLKAKRGWWRIAVLASALMYALGLLGIVAVLLFLYVGTLNYVGLHGPFGRVGNIAVAVGILYFVNKLLVRIQILPVIDFPGDVAFYIGMEDKRAELENHLVAILERAAALAPRANLLLVGHSLGSVLFASTLPKIEQGHLIRKRTALVTLGSPLSRLSKIFPDIVPSPDEVARSQPLFWINLWRNQDCIGGALRAQPDNDFAERSLGDGGHSNMWADPRLWTTIHEFLLAIETSGLSELKQRWAAQQPDDLKRT
jgi:hypothetical protein